MNSSKAIDISKSSLVGLKAELSRKQDEVEKAKSLRPPISGAAPNRISKTYPADKRKRKTKGHDDNDNDDGKLKDDEIIEDEDVEALNRSRQVLQVKSKLYTHLEEGRSVTDHDKLDYLVNFHQKRLHDSKQSPTVDGQEKLEDKEEEEEEDNYSLGDSGSENEWVDFEDALGRSRRCLRKDLRLMKEKDEHLANSLKPQSARPSESGKEEDKEEGREEDGSSGDVHHQMMRRKWEEQERKLLDKTDVHYQDLLFDEARTHGVGYYKFSTEEEERGRQLDELSRLRQETVTRQAEAQGLRERRDRQLQARLNAARLRKRQRLGLPSPPPQQPAPFETGTVTPGEGGNEDDTKRLDDIERELKRAAHVRPWDLGKDGVTAAAAPVMTQEEWVEQKRKERLNEFAPPSLYGEQQQMCGRANRQTSGGLFFTSKKLCKSTPQSSSPLPSAAESPSFTDLNHKIQISSESLRLHHTSSHKNRQSGAHSTGVEIPPPLTMEYYGGTAKRPTKDHLSKDGEIKRMRDSIEEGIGYLRKQKEMDQKKREKGLLDFI